MYYMCMQTESFSSEIDTNIELMKSCQTPIFKTIAKIGTKIWS